MPSPLCLVQDGAAAAVATTDGVDVTPANTISIVLADSSAGQWAITCIGTDDLSDAAAVTASLVINQTTKIATFTAPPAGRCYIFKSVINGGLNANKQVDPSLSTTFAVHTLITAQRVLAVNERTEASTLFGWIKKINAIIRAGVGGGGGSATPWHNVPTVSKTSAYTIQATDYLVICRTNTGFAITLPLTPTHGDTYRIKNRAPGANSIGGNGRNIDGSGTYALPAGQSVDVTYDGTNTEWVITG